MGSEPVLPKGTRPLDVQVAGHRHGAGKTKLGMLQSEEDAHLIYKAVQNPPRGTRELEFYQQVFSPACTDVQLLQLKRFMPHFAGVYYYKETPDVPYLKLENIVSKFRKPCVADIKMGPCTYDPTASAEKIASEVQKFPAVVRIGFQFTGLQVHDPTRNKTECLDKFWCRSLKEEEFLINGVGKFFGLDHHLRKDVIKALLEKLQLIQDWFDTQTELAFYASSLLVVYEGEVQNASRHGTTMNGPESSDLLKTKSDGTEVNSDHPLVDVRMIDFTHVFKSETKDENYLFGLRNLIRYLNELLQLG
ncbi:hypothetical protein ScPMuIL_004165 [Solemya velum]